jgi:hypothetical protein
MISGRFNYTTQSINAPPETETSAAGCTHSLTGDRRENAFSSKRETRCVHKTYFQVGKGGLESMEMELIITGTR